MRLIAHRGASVQAPEHTVAAYDLALAQGADALELDVRADARGELVVLHDATLARTTGDPRALAEVAWAALDPACRPLRLGDVLDRYGDATTFLLEPKEPIEREVLAAVAARGLRDRAELQTFDRLGLRRAGGGVRRGLLLGPGAPLPDPRRLARIAQVVGPWAGDVDAGVVALAHAAGVAVRPWTVNDPAQAARLAALGVDALITDVPGALRATLREAAGAVVAAA